MLGFAAVNTGNNLLYLLVSALLGFMATSGWLGQQNLRGLQLQLALPQEIFAGQPTLVGVRLQNQRWRLPSFLIRVMLGDDNPLFAQLAAGESAERSLLLTWPLRGRQQIETLWLSSCFPINFFVRSLRITIKQSLLIFPHPQQGTVPPAAGQNAQMKDRASANSEDGGGLRGIHDYRGGDPLRSIHWKLSARHGNLKVKQLEGLGTQPVIIELDRLPGPHEQRLEQAAWLIIDQLRRQRPVGLKIGERLIAPQIGSGQRQRLLTELALYHGR